MNGQKLLESADPQATRKLLAAQRSLNPNFENSPTINRTDALPLKMERYLLIRQIGEGAFGEVFLARDEILDRQVAVKVSHRVATHDHLTEARTVANLDHPHIVPVYDVGRTSQGHFCIVSKFIEGADLHAASAPGKLTTEESVRIVACVADALDYAHRNAVIHRDIKPANILLDSNGVPFITDFGVSTESRSTLHDGQQLAGTPFYMSPEQVECTSYLLDARTDVFSLGVVLYELLTGMVPFAADSLEDLQRRIAEDRPKSPHQLRPEIPKSLSAICMKAMAKQRDDRYQTAGELSAALTRWLEQLSQTQQAEEEKESVGPTPPPTPQPETMAIHRSTRRPRRTRSQRFTRLLRLFLVAYILAVLLTPAVSPYALRFMSSMRHAEAVRQLQSAGSTVIFDYQVDQNGNLNLNATSPLLPAWTRGVHHVHLGAQVTTYSIDGDTVEVITPAEMYCSPEPLLSLGGLRHVTVHQHLHGDDWEILRKIYGLRSIHFCWCPSEEMLEQLRELKPECEIIVSEP